MTNRAARIGESLARLGDKLPVVTGRMQRQFKNPKGIAVANLAVGLDRAEGHVGFTACTNDELPDALCWVGRAVRVLRCKAFVVMGMAIQDQICAGIVERLPDRLHGATGNR